MAEAWVQEVTADQFGRYWPDSTAIWGLWVAVWSLPRHRKVGSSKKMLMCQAQCVERRWFGCEGHFEGELMCRSHQLIRNGAVNQPERPSTPDKCHRPVQAPCPNTILKGLVNQRAGGREPSNEVFGLKITWGVAMN